MGELEVGGSRRDISAGSRVAHDHMAADTQRRDDARPVEDGIPGRDRFRIGTDRFPSVQCVLRPGTLRRTARQLAWGPEPHGLPAARRLRLCRDAVQLHRNRRKSSDGTRADGEYRYLEARLERDGEWLLHRAAARTSRT